MNQRIWPKFKLIKSHNTVHYYFQENQTLNENSNSSSSYWWTRRAPKVTVWNGRKNFWCSVSRWKSTVVFRCTPCILQYKVNSSRSYSYIHFHLFNFKLKNAILSCKFYNAKKFHTTWSPYSYRTLLEPVRSCELICHIFGTG